VTEISGLGRKGGSGLVKGHERLETACVDSIDDRFEHLLRRSAAVYDVMQAKSDFLDVCSHVASLDEAPLGAT